MNVPSIKTIFHQNNVHWCDISSFIKLLKENYKDSDKLKDFRNFRRDLKDDIKSEEGKSLLSLTGVIRYCYNHENSIHFCQQIVNEINSCLSKSKQKDQQNSTQETCLDLYNNIAKYKLKNSNIENILLNNVEFQEEKILYLYSQYKEHFSEKEWKRICLFELHFHANDNLNKDYEDLTKNKLKFWKDIVDFSSC